MHKTLVDIWTCDVISHRNWWCHTSKYHVNIHLNLPIVKPCKKMVKIESKAEFMKFIIARGEHYIWGNSLFDHIRQAKIKHYSCVRESLVQPWDRQALYFRIHNLLPALSTYGLERERRSCLLLCQMELCLEHNTVTHLTANLALSCTTLRWHHIKSIEYPPLLYYSILCLFLHWLYV